MAKLADDLTGKKFGRLLVLKKDEEIMRQRKCDCGNEISVISDSLRRGITKSCGCYRNDKIIERNSINRENLTGRKFGRLTVISEAEKHISISGFKSSQ